MDFLPEINMDFVPSDNEIEIESDSDASLEEHEAPEGINNVSQIDEVISKVKTSVNEETEEEDPQFMYDDCDKIIPLKLSDAELTVDEIFQNGGVPKPKIKLTKKGVPFKKRPPLSEAHKEKLKSARMKAVKVRQARAAEKKEEKDLDKEEKDLLKKQRVKKVRKLKEEVEESEPFEEIVKPSPLAKVKKDIDVEQAILEGITKYEIIRKQRKKEKRENIAKEKEEELVRDTLRRAIAPRQKVANPFSGICY